MTNDKSKNDIVSRLLSPKEIDAVSGGSYAMTTPEYCKYTQGPSDPGYKQTCPVPEKKEE